MERKLIEVTHRYRLSVIIPAHNEENHVGHVVSSARALPEVDEVVVVDDGSDDETASVAKRQGARIVRHDGRRGKGAAMKTGALQARGDILIYLDGDLPNLTPEKIRKIITPFRDGADFVKTRFDRRGGRVTQLTARPLLGHFFPDIEKRFEQPLSGQIGITRSLLDRLELEDDFGVDIGLLIDAYHLHADIREVYFGSLRHDERNLKELEPSARAVSRVVLDRASRYHATPLVGRAVGGGVS